MFPGTACAAAVICPLSIKNPGIYGQFLKVPPFGQCLHASEQSCSHTVGSIYLEKVLCHKNSDCRDCPLKKDCLGKLTQKRFSVIYHLAEYERAIARVNSSKGLYMKRKRQSTVEPVRSTHPIYGHEKGQYQRHP